MTEKNISSEVAEEDFVRFCSMARLDMDRPRNENDRRDLDDDRIQFIYSVT